MRRSLSSSACRRALASASSAARRLFRHSRDASLWHSPHQELRPSLQRGLERNSEHSFSFPHFRQLFVIQAFSRCPSRKTGSVYGRPSSKKRATLNVRRRKRGRSRHPAAGSSPLACCWSPPTRRRRGVSHTCGFVLAASHFFHLPRRAASRPSDGTKRKGSPDCSACPYRPLTSGGQGVGQRSLAVTANTYTHVLADERELDYANLLAWARSCSRGADRGSDLAR
jgi:hypothetical protein